MKIDRELDPLSPSKSCVRFNFEVWRTIWSINCPDRMLAMEQHEREEFALLPNRLIVWRGVNHEDALRSYSWTLDRDVAVRFAHRLAQEHDPLLLATGWVKPTIWS